VAGVTMVNVISNAFYSPAVTMRRMRSTIWLASSSVIS